MKKHTTLPKWNPFSRMRVFILPRKRNALKLVLEKYMRWAYAKGLSRESNANKITEADLILMPNV